METRLTLEDLQKAHRLMERIIPLIMGKARELDRFKELYSLAQPKEPLVADLWVNDFVPVGKVIIVHRDTGKFAIVDFEGGGESEPDVQPSEG